MGYTVTVNHPHFPEDTEISVGGLDRVSNGGKLEVDEDMERMFMMMSGRTLDEAFKNDHAVSIEGKSALDKAEIDSILALFEPTEVEQPEAEQPATAIDDLLADRQAQNPDAETNTTTNDDQGGES